MKPALTMLNYIDITLVGIVERQDFAVSDTERLNKARDLIRIVLENNPVESPRLTERIIERVTEPRIVKGTVDKPQGVFLKFQDVAALTGYSRSSIWRMEKLGRFPPRRELGPRSVGWLREEVEAWIASRPVKE